MFRIRRREFITLLGGAAAAWPLASHARSGQARSRASVFLAYVAPSFLTWDTQPSLMNCEGLDSPKVKILLLLIITRRIAVRTQLLPPPLR